MACCPHLPWHSWPLAAMWFFNCLFFTRHVLKMSVSVLSLIFFFFYLSLSYSRLYLVLVLVFNFFFSSCPVFFSFFLSFPLLKSVNWHKAMAEITLPGFLHVWMRLCEDITLLPHPVLVSPCLADHTQTHKSSDTPLLWNLQMYAQPVTCKRIF